MKTGKKIYLKQLAAIFNDMPEAVYVVELSSYKILYLNKFLLKALNIDECNYKGKQCYELLQGLLKPCSFCTNKSLDNQTITWSHRNCINNNIYRCIDRKVYIGDAATPAKLEIAIDITDVIGYQDEILKNQKTLKNKLKEKEILIKEIHHRVKNNTQLLVSLLHLQSMKTRSKPIKNVLLKIIERVKAISATYNSLYLNDDLGKINLSKHIEEIISSISLSILEPYNIIIEKNIEKDIIVENINKVTPLGIIINELLSNSVKHAFVEISNKETKNIIISLTKNEDTILLTVEDNGLGLPPDYSLKRQMTMGSLLVSTLASQLGARIKYNSENGTKVTLSFKIK